MDELKNIEDVVGDLIRRQSQLSGFIETHIAAGDVDLESMAKLLALLGQNASRIGRLLRDQRALTGEAADGLLGALSTALDELGTEWDREL
jgi:plasmid maintenance system antidote protein VapI